VSVEQLFDSVNFGYVSPYGHLTNSSRLFPQEPALLY
jgi:hypothetical protein